jgi:predicted CXXCH cytochrome family protein
LTLRRRAWFAPFIWGTIALPAFLGAFTSRAQTPRLNSLVCATCHPNVWQTYRRTGMARSFYRPKPENAVADYTDKNTYYHAASDTYYAMIARDGRYFQRQYQIGFDGKQTAAFEKEVDYILGSGNHVRAYLHRTSKNTLVQLPLAWYAEKGGYWAMNPGYDRPDHQGFRRNITYDCMFCHNAYPEIPTGSGEPRAVPVFSSVPEGIDCQRCHGNGEKHVTLARSRGARAEDVRNAIVNPAKLTADRQMEVCMQCHLETTSFPLPSSIVRYERGPFSYQPGEPLANFMLHFDQAAGKGYDDKFEITGSVYRLRRSQCFQRSNGALTCIRCHNPHDTPRGEEAARHYTEVCLGCHSGVVNRLVSEHRHTPSKECVSCHMPKRRSEDVVHAVMTDHYIQRRLPARDLLAEIAERRQSDATAYRGEVVLYYPRSLPKPEDELYLAIAQVSEKSNLSAGITRLSTAIDKYHPVRAEYYLQLGDALSSGGRSAEALPVYEEALRREPASFAALERQAVCLTSLSQFARAEGILKRALDLAPDGATWTELGLVDLEQGKTVEAIAALEKAAQIDPDMAEPFNSLGAIQLEAGDSARAETALRNAIRMQPNYAAAQNNLGNLLSSTGRFEEARYHYEAALRFKENYNGARFNYALALTRMHRLDEARTQLETILRSDPRSAETHEFLGNLMAAQGQINRAIVEYREAVRIEPEFGRANLDLGATLAKSGDASAALPYLRKAVQSSDATIRDEALKVLRKLGQSP